MTNDNDPPPPSAPSPPPHDARQEPTTPAGTEKKKGVGVNDNLIPFDQRAENVQTQIRSAGGKARAEKARRARDFREIIKDVGVLTQKDAPLDDLAEVTSIEGLKGKNLTTNEIIVINQYQKAINKDTRAASWIAEYGGMAPATKLEVEGNLQTTGYTKIVFVTQSSDQLIKQHYEEMKKIAEQHDVNLGEPGEYITGSIIDGGLDE